MKKVFLFGALFAVGLSFTACSSDNDVAENTLQEQTNSGKNFISLSIQMPTATVTRAANDVFDDGLNSEYKVSDATLVLFRGANAYDATYVSAYDLTPSWNLEGTTTDQITTTTKIVQQISGSDKPTAAGDKLWAYVILNKPATFHVDGSTNDLKIGADASTAPAISGTFFACFGKSNIINDAIVGNKICMSNSPFASNPGGVTPLSSNAYTVLEPIEASSIKSTKEEAALAPAATIHVERNIAKVTVESASVNMKKPDGTTDLTYTGTTTTVPFNIVAWTLSNTSSNTYFQRQVEGTSGTPTAFAMTMADWYNKHCNDNQTTPQDQYRMVGNSAVATGKYRIYWGESTNYWVVSPTLGNVTPTTVTGATGSDNPQYCYENTFDLPYQRTTHTTRVVLKAAIGNYSSGIGKTFYTLDGNYYGNATGTDDPIKNAIAILLVANPTISAALPAGFDKSETNKANLTCSAITLSTDADTKKVTPSDITLSDGASTPVTLQLNTTELEAEVTAMFGASGTSKIYKYEDGIVYYSILIKHFGDDLTPWSAADHLSTATSYNDNTSGTVVYNYDKYLGRYGVLRNNWYDINVTAVNNIGSPTIPGPGDDWDDEVKSWLAVTIKILSWAKRTQGVIL